MINGQWKEWREGDPVLINRIVWGQPELDQMQEVLNNDWFGPGRKVAEFGRALETFTGVSHCQPVNSGSSALTLAVRAMLKLRLWRKGDLIIHPVLTFPTSIAPAIQAGLRPIFIDVDPLTYQIDLDALEDAMLHYGGGISGAIIPHLLGNICDIDRLLALLDGRPLVEDCCDTLGGYYGGQHVGSFGKAAAFSFYGSHHITTAGVGGALMTNDAEVYEVVKSMTHWGRNNYDPLSDFERNFEKRYWYTTVGYDFQMTELQAAFGVAQLARLPEANELRAKRFEQLRMLFEYTPEWPAHWFCLPALSCSAAAPSWFAFPITINDAPFSRDEFAAYLMRHKIEVRPIFTGNILRQPAYKNAHHFALGKYPSADKIGQGGLFIPAWGMSDGEMVRLMQSLTDFMDGWAAYRPPGTVMGITAI